MINNPFYRKNIDSETRNLERELSAEYDEFALTRLAAAYTRVGKVSKLLELKIRYPGNVIIQNELNNCKKPWADYTQKAKVRVLRSKSKVLDTRIPSLSSPLPTVGRGVTCCYYSQDGSQIVSGYRSGALIIWDANTGRKIRILGGHTEPVNFCGYSPNGSQIVSISGYIALILKIWDANTGQEIRELSLVGHTDDVSCCDYSPDGSQIVSGSYDGYLIIWDAQTGQRIRTLRRSRIYNDRNDWITCCSFSPDGSQIAAGYYDGSLIIWEANTEQELPLLLGPEVDEGIDDIEDIYPDWITCCSFSPDSPQITAGSNEGSIRILSTVNEGVGVEIDESYLRYNESFYCCSYSPDGTQVVLGSKYGILTIFDVNTRQITKRLRGHINRINCCRYSPDGSQIVSGSNDGTLRIWRFPKLVE